MRRDAVRIDGEDTFYSYMERAEAVIIVPVTPEGEIILLRQYRYPVDEWCWEVPAGGTHDTGDDALQDVARKELKEEIGATDAKLEYISWFFSSNSSCDEKCHVFLATEVLCEAEPDTEAAETIEIHRKPLSEVLRMARAGEMQTGPCALAVLLCEERLRVRFGHSSE